MSAFEMLLALLGVFLLCLVLPNAGPVLRAARPGAGVQGSFTAERQDCLRHPGHTTCAWRGSFRSDDGTVTHAQVALYGKAEGLTAGARTSARDVGRTGKVYRLGGTREWVLSSILAAMGVLLLLRGTGLHRFARSALSRTATPRTPRTPQTPRTPSGPLPETMHTTVSGAGDGSNPVTPAG